MNRRIVITTVGLLFALSLQAQKLSVSIDTVKYGTLFKYISSSVNITITNSAPYDMQGVRLKTTNKDFTLSDSVIDLPANAAKNVKVTFRPRHNITYHDELEVISNSPYGTVTAHLTGTGFYSGSRYNATQNLWDADLLGQLKTISAQGAKGLGYTIVRDQMYSYVDNNGGKVTCVYTGRTATFNTRAGANDSGFSAEHTFPQSKFGSVEPMQSDIHHLFPADGSANTRRSNDPFGIVTSPVWMVGGSLSDNQKFEPRDQHKGTAARALIYMVTRYQDFTGFFDPQEALMREWALKFWPTTADSIRHERAAVAQGNRNPYTDHPEFIERILNFTGTAPAPVKTFDITYTQPVHFGYVPLNDTINHGVVITNTGNAAIDFVLAKLTPKPQPNVTTAEGAFTLQPRQSRFLSFRFIGKTAGANFTDSFSLQVQGGAQTILAFNANVSGLSANAPQARTNISVYPNPAAQSLYIQADRQLNYPCQVFFYDVAGKQVHSTVLNESFTELNLTALPAGCYFVQVNDGTPSSVTKLVKY